MKKKLYIILCLILLSLAAPANASQGPPCAVYIIIDTSWSCENLMQDFRSLARQASVSLVAEDYIEILSAHTNQPKIRLAQSLNSASISESKEIQNALGSIKSHFLSDASISKAVAFCLNRIKISDKQKFDPEAILVFTDGKLKSSDVKRLGSLYTELDRQDIDLYITGKDQTARKVLIAANQKRLSFSLLQDSDPAQWLSEKRVRDVEEETIVLPPIEEVVFYRPANIQQAEQEMDVEVKHRSELEVKVTTDPSPERSTFLSETVSEPEPIDMEPSIEISEPEPVSDPIAPQILEEEVPLDMKEKTKARPFSLWFLVIPGAVLMLAAMLVVFMLKYKEASKWTSKIRSNLKKSPKKNADRVIARIGDRTQQLGRLLQINKVNLGSGAKNTIRIFDKSIADQHLRLFRKKDSLWLMNISSKPAWINSIPLQPGKSSRLPLPSVVKLSDSITVKFELQKLPTITPQIKEEPNGNETK